MRRRTFAGTEFARGVCRGVNRAPVRGVVSRARTFALRGAATFSAGIIVPSERSRMERTVAPPYPVARRDAQNDVVIEARNLSKVYRDFWGRQKVRENPGIS